MLTGWALEGSIGFAPNFVTRRPAVTGWVGLRLGLGLGLDRGELDSMAGLWHDPRRSCLAWGPSGPLIFGPGGEVAMRRRMWGFGLMAAGVLGSMLGCTNSPLEHYGLLHRRARAEAPMDPVAIASETNEEAGVTSDLLRESKGFHKPGRRSGAWSREAAEIEADLGVPR